MTTPEQRLLGAAMHTLDDGRHPIDWMLGYVDELDFQEAKHRRLWRICSELRKADRHLDLLSVHDAVQAAGVGDELPASYLSFLADNAAGIRICPESLREYSLSIRERSSRNRLRNLGMVVQSEAEGKAPLDVIAETRDSLGAIEARTSPAEPDTLARQLARVNDELELRHRLGGAIPGITSGWPTLDGITLGWCPGDLILVAARPSVGKTVFALNLALHAALVHRVRVGMLSLEMRAQSVLVRLLANLANVGVKSLRKGSLLDREWAAYATAANQLRNSSMTVIHRTAGMEEIAAEARRLKQEEGLGLLVIDYLGMIRPREKAENRNIQVSEISRALKGLAIDLDVPVIALSQLNRNLERRNDDQPTLADLRDSGSLEQDADVVIFLHRKRVKGTTSLESEAKVDVAKNRQGETGQMHLYLAGDFQRFEEAKRDVFD